MGSILVVGEQGIFPSARTVNKHGGLPRGSVEEVRLVPGINAESIKCRCRHGGGLPWPRVDRVELPSSAVPGFIRRPAIRVE